MNNQEKANKLEEAARLLEINGWCRNDFVNGYGSFCAVGAIKEVTKNWDNTDLLQKTVETTCGIKSLIYFNDKKAKDKRYITRLFRKTARKLRENQ